MGSLAADHFDRLYRAHADPWRVASDWYERRKRGLLLASLGRERYRHAFEPGCGEGQLTSCLARRCDRVCAVDISTAAVERCRDRLAAEGMSHVDLLALDLSAEWLPMPPAGFDLIVVSELAYYLDAAALARFLHEADASLVPGGEIVACHWLPDFDDRMQSTDAVHDAIGSIGDLVPIARHHETQFRLDVWRRRSPGSKP